MKEKFLNICLFLLSLAFITAGIILIFFSDLEYLKIIKENFNKIFTDQKLAIFFLQLFGSFILAWGIFFFLLTVFIVMELKNTNIYGFMFWIYTIWTGAFGFVIYRYKYYFLLITLGIIYGIIFLPFLLSLMMKSKNSGTGNNTNKQ